MIARILAYLYIVAAFVTFGHSWHHIEYPSEVASAEKPLVSTVCAAFWPIYWSVQAFKRSSQQT
jgi:hypothetical protein